MQFNPNTHRRKSIRLKGYDYSYVGQYFITICTKHKQHRFGLIENGEMKHNEYGEIAVTEWIKLGELSENIEPGVFVVMPNHIHGILNILEPTREGRPQGIAPTVGDIIGSYKSIISTRCLKKCKQLNETLGTLWQRNYYEHIIRNESSYFAIAKYILNNPASWENDMFYQHP